MPESRLAVLPDVAGLDALELGCGTAYWSAWLARRGALPTGLDLSERQLASARRFQSDFGLRFPLVHGTAESLPFADGRFDLVLSEYGASIWCDPYAWVPEAARVLRPGGWLVFLVNGALLMITTPDEDQIAPAGTELLRDYFGMHRFEWKSDASVEFHLAHGDWIRLLGANGLAVEALIEVQAPPGAPPSRHNTATPEWAHRWPSEEIWKARKVVA